jgi:hypothetical protein
MDLWAVVYAAYNTLKLSAVWDRAVKDAAECVDKLATPEVSARVTCSTSSAG